MLEGEACEAEEAEEDSEEEEEEFSPPLAQPPPSAKRQKLDPSMTKSYAVDVADLLGRPSQSKVTPTQTPLKGEWQRYLDLPQLAVDIDVLAWWHHHEREFPTMSEMAYQLLAVPACSAGVERVFSKEGRNFDKSQKQTSEGHFRDLLFAINLRP